MKRIDTTVLSKRNTDIPVTIIEADTFPSKLLLCVHGFKANRTEDNRFVEVAEALASSGVSTIMMGFPGCDESKEDFINYTLYSCLDDIDSSYEYMKNNYDLNTDKIAMIGYSMGARLTSIYTSRHPEVDCICLWAGATYDGFNGKNEFLGEPLDKMKKEADEKGYCDFYNSFDSEYIKLNKKLIDQMEIIKISDYLNDYKGNVLIVHGDKDVTVEYDVALKTYEMFKNANDKKLYTVEGADHGFGAWDNHPELSKQLTGESIKYLKEHF